MPRHVDPAQRRREITVAAVRILARSGPRSLTLKSLAEELGGSITLVTHFFSNREDLFSAVVQELTEGYDHELAEMEAGASPVERLRILLQWMVPRMPKGSRPRPVASPSSPTEGTTKASTTSSRSWRHGCAV